MGSLTCLGIGGISSSAVDFRTKRGKVLHIVVKLPPMNQYLLLSILLTPSHTGGAGGLQKSLGHSSSPFVRGSRLRKVCDQHGSRSYILRPPRPSAGSRSKKIRSTAAEEAEEAKEAENSRTSLTVEPSHDRVTGSFLSKSRRGFEDKKLLDR
ncbi:predicted protein [Histoplasma capsulatum G186AR]|uniref:Uncharacterized protein n=1 Tax=Ajellomyces capsulatus (strain G186AR / H82 / ATCC MYA-2454 / RMSCC 2432) TaxID=447093 RepID=C0NDP4_AJECG|nr:uncharacterized protein HCBG_01987 [Histoplasma capsulatum G186AR]EEH10342.1 predicted protein [Histoplasma capsulatum G186AR]